MKRINPIHAVSLGASKFEVTASGRIYLTRWSATRERWGEPQLLIKMSLAEALRAVDKVFAGHPALCGGAR